MKKLSLLSLVVGGLFSLVAIGAAEPKEINYEDFFKAAHSGNVGKVKEMIQAGADVDHQDDELKSTALMWASVGGHIDVVDLLLRSGAKVDLQDKDGGTALTWAALERHIALLSELGTAIDLEDKSGYRAALIGDPLGSVGVIDFLLRYGAAIDHQDKSGTTALMLAVPLGPVAVMKLLLAGANPSIKNQKNQTALDLARQYGKEKEYLEAVRFVEKMRQGK